MSTLTSQPSGLKRLAAHHLRVVDLALGGASRQDIAKLLDMTPENVTLIQKSPCYQDEFARRRAVLERQQVAGQSKQGSILADAREDAERALVGIMNYSANEKLKFLAVESILDRTGGSRAPVTQITIERMEVFVQALREGAALRSKTVESKEVQLDQPA